MMIGAKSARTTIKSGGKGDVRFGLGSENESMMEGKKNAAKNQQQDAMSPGNKLDVKT